MEIVSPVIAIRSEVVDVMAQIKIKDLGWQEGEVRQGVVTGRLSENSYSIRVDGKDLIMQSPYFLPTGSNIAMEMQGQQEGQYLVKLLTSNTPGQEDLLKNLLDQLFIKDTPLNRNLTLGFLVQELPIKPELLQQAERFIQRLGGDSPENIEKALLSLKMGIPPESRVIEALQSFLAGSKDYKQGSESQLAFFLPKLREFLNGYLGTIQQQTPGAGITGSHLFQQVQETLQSIILKPEEGSIKLAEQLKIMLGCQLPKGVRSEAGINSSLTVVGLENDTPVENLTRVNNLPVQAAQVSTGEVFNNNLPETNKPMGTGGNPAVSQSTVVKDLPVDVLPSGDKVAGQARENAVTGVNQKEIDIEVPVKFREFGRLLEGLSRLLQEVREAVKEAGSPPQAQRLVQEGAIIERQMAGHQIFQSLDKADDQQNYLYFNLPFIQNGDSESWGQLRIIKDGGTKKVIDPSHFSMALMLNTVNMGPLLVELKVRNKEVIAGGKVTEDWVAGLFKSAWPKLQDSFSAMGYNLHPCFWQVGSFSEGLEPKGLNQTKSDGKLRMLDITV